jgi:hypothetical protein
MTFFLGVSAFPEACPITWCPLTTIRRKGAAGREYLARTRLRVSASVTGRKLSSADAYTVRSFDRGTPM